MRLVGFVLLLMVAVSHSAADWPQWRGPTGDSVAKDAHVPLRWSATENVVWKTELPGEGASTPAIIGNAIFLTAQDGDKLLCLRLNKSNGQVVWTRTVEVAETPRAPLRKKEGAARRQQKFHELHNLASPSPVADRECVIVHFGTGELVAYSHDGELLWRRNLQHDYGPYTIWWGHANSPVLHSELVINVCMQDSLVDVGGDLSPSYVVAHEKRTGKEVWRTPRMTNAQAEECDSYMTPLIVDNGGKTEIIVVGGDTLDAYDPLRGTRLWELTGIAKSRIITGPTFGAGLIYATRGMRGELFALQPNGSGKRTLDEVEWKTGKGTPDSCCPVVANGLLFWASDDGVGHCHDAATGTEKWSERVGSDCKASPLAACGRIYFVDRQGKCTVVAAEATFKKLAENRLDETFMASPAVSEGRLFLRGKKNLYCIAVPSKSPHEPLPK